MSTEELWK